MSGISAETRELLATSTSTGVFTYSDEPFLGSFGGQVRTNPIVAGAAYTP